MFYGIYNTCSMCRHCEHKESQCQCKLLLHKIQQIFDVTKAIRIISEL